MIKEVIKKIAPDFLINGYHYFLSLAGAAFYSFPSQRIKVIAITGTNGKSTTADLTSRILKEAGFRVAVCSSVSFRIEDKEEPNTLRMTMPGGFRVQKFLRKAVDAKCDYAVLEITSEGIKQHRHEFINFELAAITNLTPEHIESHKGFENYKKAKGKLFQSVKKIHIVNLDDEHADYFLSFSAEKKYGYTRALKAQSTKRKSTTQNLRIIKAENCSVSAKGINFSVSGVKMNLGLLGDFNIYNALLAICIGLSQGVDLAISKNGLEKAQGIPGRMETVMSEPFWVIVDYAFTPNALSQVYKSIRNNFKPQKMICVLGSCGGGRDKWKRPILGEIAARYCDKIVVTNEDPYDENPMEIIDQVVGGTKGRANKILDRREAINYALSLAGPGDLVMVTGKGCEPSICLAGGKQIPWDDRKVVREEFQKLTLLKRG